MTGSTALAFAAGCAGALGAVEAGLVLGRPAGERIPRLASRLEELSEILTRPGREGREPGGSERRRLLATAALAGALLGAFVAGPALGLGAAWRRRSRSVAHFAPAAGAIGGRWPKAPPR